MIQLLFQAPEGRLIMGIHPSEKLSEAARWGRSGGIMIINAATMIAKYCRYLILKVVLVLTPVGRNTVNVAPLLSSPVA
jgi:hypothetical protein